MSEPRPLISLIIPAYNEEPSLRPLYVELCEIADSEGLELEICFVDDGSTDGSWQEITDLASQDPRVRGVRLRRNSGKAAALSAGVSMAAGRYLCTLDADGQDDPAEIPNLLAELARGHDVVCGWRRPRRDPWRKTFPSRVFNLMVGKLTGLHLHDHNCGMKMYKAEVFREVRLYGELHRFLPVLAAAEGFRVREVPIRHRPRRFGRSKYGTSRFLKGLLDLLTVRLLIGYRSRPQHPLGVAGFLFFSAGLLGMSYLAATWVLRFWYPDSFPPLSSRPLLVYSLASFLFGAQMMSLAFLAALFTARHDQRLPGHGISERAGFDTAPTVITELTGDHGRVSERPRLAGLSDRTT
jgi:glycosyltransferase involved in cell wall biosynthesis